jgi:hypothetical protein
MEWVSASIMIVGVVAINSWILATIAAFVADIRPNDKKLKLVGATSTPPSHS